jgi:uncharacterized secreted protein with C-terminal beta-propeller domain
MRRLPALLSGLSAVAVLAGACAADPPDARRDHPFGGGGATGDPDAGQVILTSMGLRSFDACGDFLDYVHANAAERVGPYGLDGSGAGWEEGDERFEAVGESISVDDAEAAAPETDSGTGDDGATFSGTNVQEAGVDEPDVVKTDGRLVVAVSGGVLQVAVVDDGVPELVGTLTLDEYGYGGQELVLQGDTVVVVSPGEGVLESAVDDEQLEAWYEDEYEGGSEEGDSPVTSWSESTALSEVDLSDPSDPTLVRTQVLEGRYLSARLAHGVLRVVTSAGASGPAFVSPQGAGAEGIALEANRAVVAGSEAEDWLPAMVTIDQDGDATTAPLAECASVQRPAAFGGFGTISLTSADLSAGIDDLDVVSVMADGETVYASPDALYVATSTALPAVLWDDVVVEDGSIEGGIDEIVPVEPEDVRTAIHKFDISEGGAATYEATGEVRGHLLGQFSMSEHDGVLRVASTDGAAWDTGAGESESFVTTLAERDGVLEQLGQVGGMGEGEEIYAVRFLGDVGYVVTFEQTDPLYTIDLSDPSDPRVVGELKILGYSAYLHPVGDGLLLGVGQDATSDGRRLGSQVSLFDVSDPADPTRIASLDLGDGSSEVEWDHRAFLWWAESALALIPIESYGDGGQDGPFSGAVGLHVDRDGISEVGRLSTPGTGGDEVVESYAAPILRTLVIDDRVLALTDLGLAAYDLDTLDRTAWVPFRY